MFMYAVLDLLGMAQQTKLTKYLFQRLFFVHFDILELAYILPTTAINRF